MRLIVLLLTSIFFLSCGSDSAKEPQPVARPEIGMAPEVRERLAGIRQMATSRDSLLTRFENIQGNDRVLAYQQSLTSLDTVRALLKSGAFKESSVLTITGKTGSGFRRIYFPRFNEKLADSSLTYPEGTVLICENLDQESGKTINFEGMVKTKSGWEFLVFNSRMKPDTSGIFYKYPEDCISCHFSAVQQDPMARFGQFLNSPNPITRTGIQYDGFVSARLLPGVLVNDKTDGVFGPYLNLSKSLNNP